MRLLRFASAAVALVFAAPLCADEVARANLTIVGMTLEIERGPLATGVDIPLSVQTMFGGKTGDAAVAPPDLSVLGELTGPSLDTPITLVTRPGQRFELPALHQAGVYALQNVRLVDGAGRFLQQAVPSGVPITVANILQTNVRVRQLSADELRARGINVDGRNFDVYEYTFIFGIRDGQTIEIPYPVIVDRRSHETIIPPSLGDVHLPSPPVSGPPPRFEPPSVVPGFIEEDDFSGGAPDEQGGGGEKNPNRVRPVIPAALVIPSGFGVLHQFFATVLNVTNNAPDGASIRLDEVSATLTPPLAMRIAAVTPPVSAGQPVPIQDKATGASFLIAQAEGSAEWSLEALQPGTHTLNVVVRATYRAPNQPDIPMKGTLSASIVVSDPRFQVNFVHPDTVRKGESYGAFAIITNTSAAEQTVVVDTHEIPACTTGLFSNNICRADSGDPAPQLTLSPGETKTLEYTLQSALTGHIFAAAANADSGITASVTLAMGVSASGVPLSPATLILPYYARFLDSHLVDAQLALLGIGTSLASAPLTSRTALLPRVFREDVVQRAQDLARAGQRIFVARRDLSTDDPAEDEAAIFHLALDLLGNVERLDRVATAPDLSDWDRLRMLDENGRRAGAAMAREMERVGLASGKSISQMVDDFAAATSHRSPYALAIVHGAPVSGSARPYALAMTGANSKLSMDVPAEATGGWRRTLPYGELTRFDAPGESGEAAIVGRWSEPLQLSIVAAAPSFTVDLVYPDAADGSFLRASLPLVNAVSGTPVTVLINRGTPPQVSGANVAGTLAAAPVAQTPLQIVAAAQDLHLDPDGHLVSILVDRPVAAADRDLFALTTRVPAAGYEVTRRNDPADPNAPVLIPGAALQDDGRIINVRFDHALSTNAGYSIEIAPLADAAVSGMTTPVASIVPRVDNDRPGGIVYGRLLRGDGTAVPETVVQLVSHDRLQFDTTLADGSFLFEFVPRDIDLNLRGNYRVSAAADGKFAALDGVIRTPGEVQRILLQFLGRGSVHGTVKFSDGSAAAGTEVTAGSPVYGEFHQTTADGDGQYSIDDLPVGPITFAAVTASGNVVYAANQIHVPGESLTQDLVVQKRELAGFATVRVTVKRSDTGEPVSGAHVGVYTQGYGLADGYTGPDGTFEFTKVPAGFVSVLAAEFTITRESAGIDFDLPADSVVEQTLTLHGTVWRDDPAAPNDRTRDQPVPNGVVNIRGLAQVTADGNGDYVVPDVPLTFSDTKTVGVFDPATGRQGSFLMPTLQPGVTNELKLLLQTAVPEGKATIRVRLISAGGATVSDYRVISPGFPPEIFTPQGNGNYELTVDVPREVEVWAVPNGRHPIYGDQVVRGSARADLDGQVSVVELRLPGQGTVLARILVRKPCPSGQTTCPEEYDVAQGTIVVTYRTWDESEQQLAITDRTVQTDATSGVATIAQVPVGEHPGIATLDHPAGYASASVAPGFDGDSRQVDLKLMQLGDVTGRVLWFDGQTPAAGASVRLAGSAANLGPVVTAP
ncbi:MAG TPA: carboxypeptidase-like regulatory domain-containing protein, partial [Thermoanaerobaculia bacterium]|nr:carboxypeptidase-like regulatory domain-containing protein [Thermoanaerobaculia bacterium]